MARKKKAAEETEEKPGVSDIDKVRAEIRGREGKDAVQVASEVYDPNRIPTGVFLLDYGTLGGIPEGTAVTVFGPEDSGKSWLTLQIIREFQKKYPEKITCLGDFEKMHDRLWLRQNGIDPERVDILNPSTGQAGLDWILAYMDAEECGLVIIDSIPAVVPSAIAEKSTEDVTVAERARLMDTFCSKAQLSWTRERKRGHYCTVVFVNQIRDKVGLVFGSPESEPGGRRVKYFPMTRIRQVCKREQDDGNELHRNHTFSIVKNKGTALERGVYRVVTRTDDILPRGSCDDYKTVIDWARKPEFALITGAGSSWRINGVEEKFSKLSEMQDYLMTHPGKFLELKQIMIAQARERFGMDPTPEDGYLLAWCAEE